MKILYAIPCAFQIEQNGLAQNGLAICSDPDSPFTFIHADGTPYLGKEVWTYTLQHYRPWAKFELED